MRRRPKVYLWEAEQAAGHVLDFTTSRTLDDMTGDLMLRSAVERQLQNMGEALAQLSRDFPTIAGQLSDLSQIVGSRNVLVHGDYQLDYASVWKTIKEDVPALRTQLQELLREVTE